MEEGGREGWGRRGQREVARAAGTAEREEGVGLDEYLCLAPAGSG